MTRTRRPSPGAGVGGALAILGELFGFLWRRKAYWLIPLVAMLALVALLVAIGSVAGIGPFVYTLF